jgi:transcriptional accessory protein Tex/SPT6
MHTKAFQNQLLQNWAKEFKAKVKAKLSAICLAVPLHPLYISRLDCAYKIGKKTLTITVETFMLINYPVLITQPHFRTLGCL